MLACADAWRWAMAMRAREKLERPPVDASARPTARRRPLAASTSARSEARCCTCGPRATHGPSPSVHLCVLWSAKGAAGRGL